MSLELDHLNHTNITFTVVGSELHANVPLGTMAMEDSADYVQEALLGDAAYLDVGTTAGTVAAGDDARIVAGGAPTTTAVSTSRALTNADHNKVLLCTGSITLTLPHDLMNDMTLTVVNTGSGVISFATSGGATITPTSVTLDNTGSGELTTATLLNPAGSVGNWLMLTAEERLESFTVMLSDQTTDLTTGTSKVEIRMPYAFLVTAVRAFVNTAPTGDAILVDVNEGVTSILSTVISIDATEKTSTTSATPAVISDGVLADDASITFDIDQVGSTNPGKGLGVHLIGVRL